MSATPSSDLERQALGALRRMRDKLDTIEQARHEPMAIVGMACRFPGADDADAFWDLLCRGGDAIVDVPPDRWDADAPATDGVRMPSRAGLLAQVDGFDADFFGIAGREAQLMDPQQRLFLELAWQALENAAIPPLSLKNSRTGVFVGVTTSDYLQLLGQRLAREELDAYMASGNTLNAIAGRVSYTLGLQGPAMAIDTACSSSLVAIDRACRSLRDGESRMAIAGGVNLTLSPDFVLSMARWGMLAADGRCKAFDAAADGFVRAEGCGVLVIKRLSDALADGDRIRALLRGWAVNQGGASGGFSVPNGIAQAAVLRDALAQARLAPATVGFVEAHGTGTPLGDPIEMEAIAAVYGDGRGRDEALWVGAVKTNVGHLEAAAGVAGVVKAVLALEQRCIPPNLHLHAPNPNIDWARLPVRLPGRIESFTPIQGRRLAGVSSFGFSGTNAHVILEEAPGRAAEPAVQRLPSLLLTLSARSPAALDALAQRYAAQLERDGQAATAICLAAAAGRSHLPHRLAVNAADAATLAARLRDGDGARRGRSGTDRPGVAFLFTGQGSQYPGMGARLARASPVFRHALERCAALIDPLLGEPLLPLLLDEDTDAARLARTGTTQPALFALEVALVEWWRSVGVQPAVVLGHSVGEFAAAWCAGVLSLEDAATLVTLRGALMQQLPAGGAMAAVFAGEQAVRARMNGIPGVLAVAALNEPGETVVSGDAEAVRALSAVFAAGGVRVESLAVSHAFHSPRMAPMLERFAEAARRIERHAPGLPVVSSMSGRAADEHWATPAYWLEQLQAPVRWHDALHAAAQTAPGIALEIGPHPVLTGLGRRVLPDAPIAWLPSLRRGQDDGDIAMRTLGELYVHGAVDDWSGSAGASARSRVALPLYPFQHQRHWVDAPRRSATSEMPWRHPLLGAMLPLASGDLVFQSTAGDRRHAWVRDHRMQGLSIWPAAASLEMLFAAAHQAALDPFMLKDVEFRAPLPLPEGDEVTVQTVLRDEHEPGWSARICSAAVAAEPRWTSFVSARIVAADASLTAAPDPAAARSRCSEAVDTDSFYASLWAAGATFGPAFRSLSHVGRAPGEAFGQLGGTAAGSESGFALHPALLDGALQLATIAAAQGMQLPPGLWLPTAVEQVRLHRAASGPLWAHARLHEAGQDAARLVVDLAVWNAQHALVLSAHGLRFVRGRAEDLAGSAVGLAERCGLELAWQRLDAADAASGLAASRWQVVGDGGLGAALTAALTARGQRAGTHVLEPDHLVHLAALELPASSDDALAALRPALESALKLAQAHVGAAAPPRLWLVTRAARRSPLAATLVGLSRVLRAEHPALRCTLVDLDADSDGDALALALLAIGDRESQVELRDGDAWVARLARLPAAQDFRLDAPRSGRIEDLRHVAMRPLAPGPGEVRIDVQAAGLNFRDVLRALGMVEGLVDALGGECAGRIAALGAGVTDCAVGDEVFAIAPGGLATSVCVPRQLVAHRPAGLGVTDAAALPIACLTASYGFDELAGLRAGQRVLIHAATGGVGLAAVQLARLLGAEVFATAGSESKRALLRAMGLRHVFDSRSLDFVEQVRAATDGQGVDVLLNSLAGDFIAAGLSLVAPGGCFLELGKRGVWSIEQVAARFPTVRYHVYDLGTVALQDAALARRLFTRLLARLASGQLTPLPVAAVPMREAASAFQTMARGRHVGKLVLLRDLAAPAMPQVIRADASYLVTGGFGALGLAVAEGLARRGARHLVLAGRKAPSPDATAVLERLAGGGVSVRCASLDVADAAAVRALFGAGAAAQPPLRGIVHAAGVLDDGVVERQDWARFETVLRPKLLGAMNLAAATAGLELDFFVLFSAGAAWLGAPGQSNYAAANASLDALAQSLRSQGRAATAIAWGRWAGPGMAAARGGASWAAQGVAEIVPADGIAAMFELIDRQAASVAVLPLDWPTYLRKTFVERSPACFDPMLPATGAREPGARSLLGELRSLPGAQRREALQRQVEAVVRKVVGLGSERIVEPQRPLRELGMDSLMTIELRNAIGALLEHPMSPTLVFDHPTLDALSAHLMTLLPGLHDEEAASPSGAGTHAALHELSDEQAEAELLAELARDPSR